MRKRPTSAKIIERVPQTVHLRSGMVINFRNKQDAGQFWHIFSSSEYLSLVPLLSRYDMEGGTLLDCGAAIGLFTLLMEQMGRVGVMPKWGSPKLICVEPAEYNGAQLVKNISANIEPGRFEIHHNAVGRKSGTVVFNESRKNPWSSSLRERPDKKTHEIKRDYIDLDVLNLSSPLLVKMDIEGAEFDAIEHYQRVWEMADALVIEWHDEMGDIKSASDRLESYGLRHEKRCWDFGDRIVDFFSRTVA